MKRGLVKGGLVKRRLVKRGLVKRRLVNRGLVKMLICRIIIYLIHHETCLDGMDVMLFSSF